ncbi:C-type lectin, conserved site,C-type lectin fold,C-type lectin-like/link domain,C-type lectin-like [Cinara cedri]|uniref:C-type lectin, conserved site,C-type lectin fold,C-type lectin-like/link domain,C-type lectin-like n=1 Tax=Cinara cedri TaxID=506608 RepID=A0A5E4NGE2_9HEMI|nr:C-type lectin, conserved site,C-type lectin fold,C-type lectin-like/link domain,C-type lectin-like [Cinara cedri]
MTGTVSLLGYFALALTVTSCLAAISDVKSNNPVTQKPGRFLSLPVPLKCSQRPKEFTYKGRNYFYSGHTQQYKTSKVDWLEARNICREYCMDLVSIETEEENNLIFRLIQQNDAPYIWTSGRLCDFKGCENRTDLEPKNVNGWFWSATRGKILATDQTPNGWSYNPWSKSGHKKKPQPDNAEFDINGTVESCLSVLNNVYGDGIAWHDIGCYHEKPFVCEDSDELINYVASTNPSLQL